MNTLPSGNAQSSEEKGHTNKDVPHALIKASKELCLDWNWWRKRQGVIASLVKG